MSRDLKNEYEAMLDQEIPDLWSRIEPRLAEKTGQGMTAQAMMHAEVVQEVQKVQGVQNRQQTAGMQELRQEAGIQGAGGQTAQQEKKTRRHLRRSTIAVWTSLAAACVCLALILPAWTGGNKGEDRTNQIAADTSSATDNGAFMEAEGMPESGTTNGYEPEYSDAEVSENNTASDDGATLFENADAAASPQEFPTAEDAALQESDGDGQRQDGFQGDMSAPAEEETDEYGTEESKQHSQYAFYGEIIDMWETKEGFFYHMELKENAGDDMPAGSEIVIIQKKGLLAGLHGTQELAVGNCYRVDAEIEVVDGETRYVFLSCEEVCAE